MSYCNDCADYERKVRDLRKAVESRDEALASQSESHATELARLKEERRAELEKAWSDGYNQCHVNEHGPMAQVTDGGNPYSQQSKESE